MNEANDVAPTEYQVCFTRDLTQRQLVMLMQDKLNDGWHVAKYADGELVFGRQRSPLEAELTKTDTAIWRGTCLVCLRPLQFERKAASNYDVIYRTNCACGAFNELFVLLKPTKHAQQSAYMRT